MKNKKILIVIAIALVCLIAATVCLIAFLSPMRTTFYVFKGDYKAGTTITKEMLTPVQADSRLVVAGTDAKATTYFITNENLGDLVKSGDALRTDVKKGEAFAQGVFLPFGITEDDDASDVRTGGFGSTDRK